MMYSVKRSDITGNCFEWELDEKSYRYIRPIPPYFIVLANSVTTMEVKAIDFHRIDWFMAIFQLCFYRLHRVSNIRCTKTDVGLHMNPPLILVHHHSLKVFQTWNVTKKLIIIEAGSVLSYSLLHGALVPVGS